MARHPFVGRTDTFELMLGEEASASVPLTMTFPLPFARRAPAIVGYAAGEALVAQHDDPKGGSAVLVILGQPADPEMPPELGLFSAMSAAEARNFAAGLIRVADRIDGGKGVQ